MQIKVVLFGMLRERLAKGSRGRLEVELPEASDLSDLLAKLDIRTVVNCSINGQIERDFTRTLRDGEEVQIFQPVGGGGLALWH